ncbi:MAG TPA: hypothetical protein VEC93_15975, partial [Anaerolineae bacterium]|nr:hypothetical protein [Anaerolineae bacterium]
FPQMTALNGNLYGSDWYLFGIGYRWAWRDGRPWVMTEGWSGGSNTFQVDSKRQRLYESVDGNLRVFDAQSMDLLLALPQPVAGELVGYDPKTDQLYFRDERQLQVWPAAAIEHPQPQSLSPALPPAEPANFLAISPQWPQDKTLVGLWGYQNLAGDCYVFGQSDGSLFISNDGGNTWGRPSRGLPANCGISTLALSPNYLDDQTILVGVEGWGLFRSTDGGQSWTPSNKGLASLALNQILLSPGFAHDRIAFARSSGALYRSDDGGQSWQLLSADDKVFLHLVAMSPEFKQDQTLMGATYDYQDNKPRTTLHLSRDGGYHWQQLGQPWDVTIIMLSLAPLFDKWQVVFAFSDNGTLARSSNGGLSWEVVLDTAQRDASAYDLSAQLVFAPNIEVNRPLFFLVTNKVYGSNPDDPPSVQGTLYRSGDGGMTWEEAELPNNIVPTTLAISPTFAQDGRLFLGQADGQVEIMETPIPPNPSGNPHQIISFTAEKTQENGVLLSWEAIGKRAYICPLVDPGTRFDCKTIYDQAYDGKIAGSEIWPADKIEAKFTGFRLTVEGANGTVESVEVPISGLSCAQDWFFGNPTELCPSAPITSFATAQRFEHGQMIWIEKLDKFYIFYDSGLQASPTNLDIVGPLTLKPNASVDNHSGETPPPGYWEPVGNFGLIWRGEVEYPEDVRDRLGRVIDPEISFETVYQCDVNSYFLGCPPNYLRDPEGKILNLYYVMHFGIYWREQFNWETYSNTEYGYSVKSPDFLIHSTDTYQGTGGLMTVDKWLPADQNYVISIFSYEDGVNPALE